MSFFEFRKILALATGLLMLAGLGAFAQTDQADARAKVKEKTEKLSLLEAQIGEVRRVERDLQSGETIAIVTAQGATYQARDKLMADLRSFVIISTAALWKVKGDYQILAQLADADYIKRTAAAMMTKFEAESAEWLRNISATRAALERQMGLLRDELEDLGVPVGTAPLDVVTVADKKALKDRAGEYARDSKWHPDDFVRVAVAIDSAKTRCDLELAEKYMNDYESCHQAYWSKVDQLNADRAAGKFPLPGNYISARDQVTKVLRQCLAAADTSFNESRLNQ